MVSLQTAIEEDAQRDTNVALLALHVLYSLKLCQQSLMGK
jgi:hypothetical protein